MLTIQVKSLSKRNAVAVGTNLDKIMGDFWIVVNSIGTGRPRSYILLPHEVRAMARRTEKEGKVAHWLEPKNYAIEAFEEKWQRIGSPSM